MYNFLIATIGGYTVKKIVSIILVCIILSGLVACSNHNSGIDAENGKVKIVAAMFAEYDFARQIVGEKGQVDMLMPAGSEIHSYEPTPQDIINIKNADIFIYGGGESEEWLDTVLDSIDTNSLKIISMMDICELYEEEIIEGMENDHVHDKNGDHVHEENEDEHHHHDAEYDEHVWTSPLNAIEIIEELTKAVIEIDSENKEYYENNSSAYINEIKKLHQDFQDAVSKGKTKTLIFADRFPFRYFVEEYGFDYIAAFPGCSHDTEPSAKTIRYIIDKIKEDNVSVIFTIENSNQNVAETISNETGTKILEFHSCHNVAKADFDSGVTYLQLMKKNLENLKEAIN